MIETAARALGKRREEIALKNAVTRGFRESGAHRGDSFE